MIGKLTYRVPERIAYDTIFGIEVLIECTETSQCYRNNLGCRSQRFSERKKNYFSEHSS